MKPQLDLLLFTCEGREHLLRRTWQSLAPILGGLEGRRVLAIDGQIASSIVELINPDVVVQNPKRRGYICSILNALAMVNSECFLWLEDDWQVEGRIDPLAALSLLYEHPLWFQVRWSKSAPLKQEDVALSPGVHVSSDGFSANPCVCRTEMVREGFRFLQSTPKGTVLGVDGFENVLTRWSAARGLVNAVFDPGEHPAVSHLGDLESTGREWHMTSSLDSIPTTHLSALPRPPYWRRLLMTLKLGKAVGSLALKQFCNDRAYETAFRIVAISTGGKL